MNDRLKIVSLSAQDEGAIEQVAELLVEGFRENWPEAWPTLVEAKKEVYDSFEPGRISLVGLNEANRVVGWVGGIEQYDGLVWELHPLVVGEAYRGQGIGRQLVTALEEQVRQRGALTLWLGSDDENNQTTLSGVNLYTDTWKQIANIKNLRRHPYEFYQKLGFVITGVMPDANGPGKPDIYMAKSLVDIVEQS